jgi:hypothetical protein
MKNQQLELFSELGCQGFSMRLLARRVACSHGNLTRISRKKCNCLIASSKNTSPGSTKPCNSESPESKTGNPVRLLEIGIRVYVDFGLANPHTYKLTFIVGGTELSRPRQPYAAFEYLRATIRRCVEEKSLRPVDVETTSQALWAVMHGVSSLPILRPTFPRVAKERLIQQVIDNAITGLLRQPRPTKRKRGRYHVERNHRPA